METEALELSFTNQWTITTSRCKASLVEDEDLESVAKFTSWIELQGMLNDVPPSIAMIRPSLSHLSIFTEFFKTRLGPILDASFLWGTLARLLQLVAEQPETLSKVPHMVKNMAHKAEYFNALCEECGIIDNLLKEACFDMQILFVEFFTISITYIHGVDELPRQRSLGRRLNGIEGASLEPSQRIERRYATVVNELGETLTRVEKMTRHGVSTQSQTSTNAETVSRLRCCMLPSANTSQFFDRLDIFEKLDQSLGSTSRRMPFRSVALHGLGGVGKSTIASSYVERKFNEKGYDFILWARSEKLSSLRQSMTDIATRLRIPGAQPQSHDENLILVQDWFQSTESRWLIVYDNVETADMLMPYWPASSYGKAIITTRNHSLAFEPASSGLEVSSWNAQTGSEFLLHLLKRSIGKDLKAEHDSALVLSKRLSGHALAISSLAGLIHDGNISIEEFMNMYLKNPRGAHATNEFTALWDFSFSSLDLNSQSLLGAMSYLMPDVIPQELFEVDRTVSGQLDFCADSFAFSTALKRLLKLALIKRQRDTRVLSIHRMVQTQFKYFLDSESRQRHFNSTVALVYDAFPKEDTSKGQLYEVWETCNRYLQQVINLKDCFEEEMRISTSFRASWQFCELLIQCQRYLYEANALTDLESLCDVNSIAVETLPSGSQKNDLKATIMSHQASLAESLGNATQAIDLNRRVYELRLNEKPLKHILLCYISNNLGYCYNTANDHQSALEWFQKSSRWWDAFNKSRGSTEKCPAFIVKNTARCMIYLGDLDGAQSMLDVSIPRMNDTNNWAMLAYAYFVLGTLKRRQTEYESAEAYFIEAQNYWLKGDQTRLHPFNAGAMLKIGACCLDQGKVEATIKHIRDSITITKFHMASMPVEHARSLFKLSEALLQDGRDGAVREAEALRDEAEVLLKSRVSGDAASSTEEAYDRFIPIFWR